jgi:glyoxylase-like metal-dependent hydrolase (beta-lactamase superfamily II)
MRNGDKRHYTRLAYVLALFMFGVVSMYADSYLTTERNVAKLAEGVYEIRHPDAPDGFPQGNTTVIIGSRGVMVVDSGLLPSSTRQDIAQIRTWTDKPVLYVVNTHWHFDHCLGNGIYVQEFPAVQVVAQKVTQKLIREVNPAAMARYPLREQKTRLALDTGKKSDGSPLTEGERKRYEKRLAGLQPTLAEFRNAIDFAPNVAFDQELDVDLGGRPVQIKFLGKGNTSGDTVVYLPAEKILAAGDLIDHPVPYFFGDMPVDHVTTLERVAQLDVQTIVPGHGEVLHGKDYIYLVIDLLLSVNAEVEKEVNAGTTDSDEIERTLPQAIGLGKWREKFVGSDPVNSSFFDASHSC